MGRWRTAGNRRCLALALVAALLALPGCGQAAPDGPRATTTRATATATRATATVAIPPANFALAFTRTNCGESDIIDTFAGTFTVVVPLDGRYRGGTRTVPFALTAAEALALDQQLVAMAFFAYPPELGAAATEPRGTSSDYTFRVRRAGAERTFVWRPKFVRQPPPPPPATPVPTVTTMERDLLTLVQLLVDIANAHPEARAVPRGVSCT